MIGLPNPESVLRSERQEPNPSVQVSMPEHVENSFVAVKAKAGNRFERWLKMTSTIQKDDKAGKLPVVTNTDMTSQPNVANKDDERWV